MPLQVERLEPRLLPTAAFRLLSNGTLLVTGDARADSIAFVGGAQGQVTLSVDQDGDSVRELSTSFTGVQSLYVAAGDGADIVLVRNVNLLGGAQIYTGLKSDRVEIESSIFRAELKLGLGEDQDYFHLRNASEVQGRVSLDGGQGHDELRIEDQIRITDAVIVTGGQGDDRVELHNNVQVLGEVKLQLGEGANRGRLTNTVHVGTNVTFTANGRDDEFRMEDNVDVLGYVSINAGHGLNQVSIEDDISIRGALSISTGGGADEVDLRQEAAVGSVAVGGQVTIQTGSGSDRVRVSGNATLDSLLVVKTGADNDRLELGDVSQTTTTRLAGGLFAQLGSGNDEFTVVRTSIFGAGTVNAGSGIDAGDKLGFNSFIPDLLAVNFDGGNINV